MARAQLRVYYGPEKLRTSIATTPEQNNTVNVRLKDIAHLLADAVQSRRTWLKDFADDEVTLSNDLYELLLTYQHFCRPSA
jgi:hypothetical protein